MPPSRRTPQDPRRPRVAGLRKRTQQESSRSTGSEEQASTVSRATAPESASQQVTPKNGSQDTSATTPGTQKPDPESVSQVADTPAAGTASETEATTTAGSVTSDSGTEADSEDVTPTRSGTDGTNADGSGTDGSDAGDSGSAASGSEPVTVATLPGEQDTSATERDSEDDTSGRDTREEGDTARDDGSTSVKRSSSLLVPLLLAASVVCAALAVWFFLAGQAVRGDASDNQALVDAAATSEVNGQVTKAVETLFSYDFADTAKTENAAKELLVGDAVGKYEDLFKTVKEQAPAQKLVVTTTVKASGVTQLQDDRAEVLLFVDQNAVRTDVGQDNVGPAQLSVTAKKVGDTWKISQINPR